MRPYLFRAIDEQAIPRDGIIHAASRQSARALLEQRQLTVLSVRRPSLALVSQNSSKNKHQRCVLFSHLAQLLRAGLPLPIGVHSLADEARGGIRHILKDIGNQLEEGISFLQVIQTHPSLCDPVSLAFLCAGEKTGNLPHALDCAATYLQREQRFRTQLIRVMRYPAFVAVLLVFTLVVFSNSFLPPLLHLLRVTEREHNFSTQSLLWVSDWGTQGGIWGLVIVILSGGLLLMGGRFFKPLRLFLRHLWSHLPIWEEIRLKSQWAQFFAVWGLLLESGTSLVDALNGATLVVSDESLQGLLKRFSQRLLEGSSVALLFLNVRGVSASAYQLLVMGEKTGQLPQALSQITALYTEELSERQEKILTFAQPACLLLLGTFFVWIVCGAILPLYDPATLGGGL